MRARRHPIVLAAGLIPALLLPPCQALAGPEQPDPNAGGRPGKGWGLGLGVVSSPRPYVGLDHELFPVPLVKYERGGFFIEGIRVGYRWTGDGGWGFGLFAMPQFAGLDPDDSPFLAGMEERETSVDAAASVSWSDRHLELGLTAYADLLGRNDGRRLRAEAGFPFEAGRWRLTPSVGMVWYDDDFVNYYAGVRPAEALPARPAYDGSSTVNPEAGLDVIRTFARRWLFFMSIDYQRLGSEITDSPVVDADEILGGFAGIAYLF